MEPFAFRFADPLGPAKIIEIYEPSLALKAVLVVDNVACGPAIGGIRLGPNVTIEECFRLARVMTLKNAAAGLPHGGGKSVIVGDPSVGRAEKERMIRAFARAIADIKDYIPGPDMGTDERAMAWVKDEIGRAVGLPREIGGIPLDEIGATGLGVAVAAEAAPEFAGVALRGARVAVQGYGAVGRHAAHFLKERGALIVAVADSKGTLVDPGGIDLDELDVLKREGRSVTEALSGEKLPGEAIIDVSCEIWIPAAQPDVLREDNVERLQAKLVVEGANIPATPEAEARLHARNVLVVPDFIANAGGVICGSVEYHGGTQAAALTVIEEKVRANTREVLDTARRTRATPRAAGVRIAEERVRRAMDGRRRF